MSLNDSSILVLSKEGLFHNSTSFYNTRFVKTFDIPHQVKKIIVLDSDKEDKITLGNIINYAKKNNLDVDFYGRKTDETGLLTDSSEFLLINCPIIHPF